MKERRRKKDEKERRRKIPSLKVQKLEVSEKEG